MYRDVSEVSLLAAALSGLGCRRKDSVSESKGVETRNGDSTGCLFPDIVCVGGQIEIKKKMTIELKSRKVSSVEKEQQSYP